MVDIYSAGPLESLGDNKYRATLLITRVDENEVEKEHFLVVKSPHDDDVMDNERQ